MLRSMNGLRASRLGRRQLQKKLAASQLPVNIRCFSTSPDQPVFGELGKRYEDLVIGVPKESFPLERRVSQTPESVEKLVKAGFSVRVSIAFCTETTTTREECSAFLPACLPACLPGCLSLPTFRYFRLILLIDSWCCLSTAMLPG